MSKSETTSWSNKSIN